MDDNINDLVGDLIISSPAVSDDGYLPAKYTCEGDNINPPFDIGGIPEHTRSMCLVFEDVDAPAGIFIHWLVYDMPPDNHIAENSSAGVVGINSFGNTRYEGPCPPTGTHRYLFKLYALDAMLQEKEGATVNEIRKAMTGHVLTMTDQMVRYYKIRNV